MALSFVLGKASCDHRQQLVMKIAQAYQQHPHDHFFYLVPNHIKFTAEIDILRRLKRQLHVNSDTYAQSQVQVFSFSRLAWYWLKDEPIMQQPNISEAGLALLVNRILLKHQNELQIYGGEVHHAGFMNSLVTQLHNLTTGCFNAEDLQHILMQLPQTGTLTPKLHDLAIIKQDFDGYRLRNTHYLLDVLNETLQNPRYRAILKHTHFYIDGFADFSAQELQLITTFIHHAADVTATLPLVLDDATKHFLTTGTGQTLFMQPARTYQRLLQKVNQTTTKIDNAQTSMVNPALQRLEDYWIQAWSKSQNEITTPHTIKHVHVWRADNRYAELRYVVKQIRQAVLLKGMHYRDFIIMARDLTPYENIMPAIFAQADVPYFNDKAQVMLNHSLVNFVNALLLCYRNHCQYQDVMRLLRSELLIPYFKDATDEVKTLRQYVDATENYVLKHGINGSDWLRDDDWQYYDHHEKITKKAPAQVQFIHKYIQKLLRPFINNMHAATTNQAALQVLYTFLDDNGVRLQMIKRYRYEKEQQNDLQKADQEKQVWNTFSNLLDEFAELLGNEPFDIDEFIALFKTGFANANFSQIPATLDQVLVSEMGVQANNHQVAFIIGATDDVLPRRITDEQLLTDFDRQQIQPILDHDHDFDDKFLPEDRNQQMSNEPYLVYRALMTPKQALIFTYPQVDDASDEKQLHLSPYVQQIKDYFALPIKTIGTIANNDDLTQIGSLRQSLSDLVTVAHQQLLTTKNVNTLSSLWLTIYQILLHNPAMHFLTKRIMNSLDYQNIPQNLTQAVVTALYADEEKVITDDHQQSVTVLPTSVSRLEQFYRNNYEYFLQYGLKLKPRDIYTLQVTDSGTLFHNALQQIISEFDKYDPTKVQQIFEQLINDERFKVLKQNQHMRYLSNALLAIIKQMSRLILYQNQQIGLKTVATEVSFNNNRHDYIPGMNWQITDKWGQTHHVQVNGRIDRIDEVKTAQHNYLLLVDYKSGDKKINYGLVDAGLQLQMMTYLDALQKGLANNNDIVAGALYLHLQNYVYKPNDLSLKQMSASQINTLLQTLPVTTQLGKNQYQGLLLNDHDAELLHHLVTDQDHSMYKIKWTNKGALSKSGTDPTISSQDLALLLKHTEALIKEAVTQIYSGQLTIMPARWDNHKRTALQYSDYLPILQFDNALTENQYREIATLSLKDLLAKLRKEADDDDDSTNA